MSTEDIKDTTNLNILYEDNHIIVVIKPPGIPSQADKTKDLDMLTIVKNYIKVSKNKPGEVYLGLVHRLDRGVGGIMVFAKTSKAASRISKCIREKDFKKRYLAVIENSSDFKESDILENYLIKDSNLNKSFVVSQNEDSKLASLEYKTIQKIEYKNKEYNVVDINLYTGRHHQIRVQFSNISCPIYGDKKYGSTVSSKNIALWSYYLSFYHPTKDEYLEFTYKPNKFFKNSIWDVIN